MMLLVQNQAGGDGLTVQDRPGAVRVYNGVNPSFPGVRLLSSDPPVFAVDQFLSPVECDFLIRSASDSFGPAPVVGKGIGEISPSRTSSTCYLAREDVPDLLRKVSLLTGKPMEHCELPQVGRYLQAQQYLQHYDAFDLGTEDGRRFALNGGQRVATVLVYLNDVPRGGATRFPCLGLDVQPRKGTALVFFPATIDGALDRRALHAALPAVDTKYVSQIWIRQGPYSGLPSKRLEVLLGSPLSAEEVAYNNRLLASCGASPNPFLLAGPTAAPAAAAASPFSITMPPTQSSSSQACQAVPFVSSMMAMPTAVSPLIQTLPSLHAPLQLAPQPLVFTAGDAASMGLSSNNSHPHPLAVFPQQPWTVAASCEARRC